MEAHESFADEEEGEEEENSGGRGGREGALPSMTSLFPLPIEESPSHQPGMCRTSRPVSHEFVFKLFKDISAKLFAWVPEEILLL